MEEKGRREGGREGETGSGRKGDPSGHLALKASYCTFECPDMESSIESVLQG